MKKKWTRRKFLQTSLGSSLTVKAAVAGSFSAAEKAKRGSAGLSRAQRQALRTAMDEIIPAADDMPAASAVGGVEYLDRLTRQEADVRNALQQSLAALEGAAERTFRRSFVALSSAERLEALKNLEGQSPSELFTTLRDFTYEAYYTQPQVWKLIGYEFHPTNEAGPRMKPFDEAALAQVRKKPKLYREVT